MWVEIYVHGYSRKPEFNKYLLGALETKFFGYAKFLVKVFLCNVLYRDAMS